MFLGAIIGFRHWRINPGARSLTGPISNFSWPVDRRVEGECLTMRLKSDAWKNPEPHDTPDEKCKCGIYGYHDIENALGEYCHHSWSVFGSAVYWGRIEVHTVGFKAQYARPVALVDTDLPPARREERDVIWPFALDEVSEKYRIPVVPLDLLEEYTSTFGSRLGTEFIE